MPKRSPISDAPPAAVKGALEQLGRYIRIARVRRRLPQEALAGRLGVSRKAILDIEKGKASTSVAAYLGALWALGLLDQIRQVAAPENDEEGLILDQGRAAKTAGRPRRLDDTF